MINGLLAKIVLAKKLLATLNCYLFLQMFLSLDALSEVNSYYGAFYENI